LWRGRFRPPQSLANTHSRGRTLWWGMPLDPRKRAPRDWGALMLPVGILLRIVVFLFLAPINADQ